MGFNSVFKGLRKKEDPNQAKFEDNSTKAT